MNNPIIKSYHKQISESTTQEEKLAIASHLHEYDRTLTKQANEAVKETPK
jgi:hypothetical protein